MSEYESPLRRRGLTVLNAALVFLALILVCQIWLLTASVESYLAGHYGVAIPAMLVSGVLLCCAAALIAFVRNFDRKLKANTLKPGA